MQQQQQQLKEPLRRRRPRGVLAFLGQQEHVTQYPYDSDAWKTPKPIPTRSRSTRRSRRNRSSNPRQQSQPQPPQPSTVSQRSNGDNGNDSNPHHDHLADHSNDEANGNAVPATATRTTAVATESRRLVDICEEYPVILLFLFDPHQPHSFQIRNQLVRLCAAARDPDHEHEHDGHRRHRPPPPVHCLCATMMVADQEEDIGNGAVAEFLRDTGFSQFTVTAAVQTCFHWNRAPYLTVVGRTYNSKQPKEKSSTGNNHHHIPNYSRKVISTTHEELALTWNPDQVSVERWLEGQSALSCQQQGMAMAIFPSCSIM
jgi:hypothetical protein